jgi:hypothetical protein
MESKVSCTSRKEYGDTNGDRKNPTNINPPEKCQSAARTLWSA